MSPSDSHHRSSPAAGLTPERPRRIGSAAALSANRARPAR